jgi:hypothetical protein
MMRAPTVERMKQSRIAPLYRVAPAALSLAAVLISGCGSNVSSQPSESSPLSIYQQPASLSVPLGESATFSVAANGAQPFRYQWSENGNAISGAVSSSYSTPAVGSRDSGEAFTVTVTDNAGASVTSNFAVLTVGPRSPKAGDLRFQQVAASSTISGYAGTLSTTLPGRSFTGSTAAIGSPLSIGPGSSTVASATPYQCLWQINFFTSAAVGDLSINYYSNYLEEFDTDLAAALADPSTVIASLDTETSDDAYAVAYVTSSLSSGFSIARHSVALDQLQTAAAQEGSASRVITAVSFMSGTPYYISYGWSADTATQFDVSVVSTSFDKIPDAASSLSSQGYIITALGGNVSDGFLLVGTKVKGDVLPRPLKTVATGDQTSELWQAGYAQVGFLVDSQQALSWIGQR